MLPLPLVGSLTAVPALCPLVIEAARTTAAAVIDNNFKLFDALIGNFGCQTTASQLHQLLSRPELRVEACAIIEQGNAADFQVSPDFLQLVKFRILNIINNNIRDKKRPDREKPVTDCRRLRDSPSNIGRVPLNPISGFVRHLQAEESQVAAHYVEREAEVLTLADTDRAPLLQHLLSAPFRREKDKIVSTMLLHNTEVVFRRAMGLILVRQKTHFLGERIPNVTELKVFMRFPEQEILEDGMIVALPESDPVIVVEGYVFVEDLAARIRELGFFNIINANTAVLPQYISGVEPVDDPQALEDIADFARQRDIVSTVFEVEHVFCASLKEVR